jgi:uncharacterized protein (DUF1778 family)
MTVRLEVRINKNSKKIIKHAANLIGISITDFVTIACLNKAHQEIEKYMMCLDHVNMNKNLITALLKKKEDKINGK